MTSLIRLLRRVLKSLDQFLCWCQCGHYYAKHKRALKCLNCQRETPGW